MKKKLIALDLDGTTLNNQSQLTNRTISTLQKVQDEGHIIMIATGRPYRNSKQFYQALGLTSPLVNFNGALCHLPESKDFYHKTLDLDLVMDLLEHQEELGIDWISVEGKQKLYATYKEIPVNEFYPKNTQSTFISTATKLDENPTALSLFMDEDKQESIRNKVIEKYGDLLSVRTWGGQLPCLEIVAPGIQKSLGVEEVARFYGIDRQNIMAFGDEDNDMEMIDYAGHGVVMSNGIEKLKNIANDITDFSNNEDGLALYLEKYFAI